jgi:hypothetical protein
VEVVDPRCIGFMTSQDYGNIMVRECRIIVHRCLLKRLKVSGSI